MAKFVPQSEMPLSDQVKVRHEKLEALRAQGLDPFVQTKFDVTSDSAAIKAGFDAMEGQTVRLAGRLMSKRGMGKVSFCDLQDSTGRIQLYVKFDEMEESAFQRFKKNDIGDIVGIQGDVFKTERGEISVRVHRIQLYVKFDEMEESAFQRFKKNDIGDIVGIQGDVFKTERGEISVRVHKATLLSKALLPLPEKFHGLTDTETRYRQRYVDLIVNPNVKDTFVKRSRIMTSLRHFLDSKGFLEVDTPILTPFEIGASARPFYTHHNTLDMDMVLRIETELYLKRLVVGGMERVYEFEIGASARPFYTHHNTLDMDMVLRIETELYLKRLVVGGMERVYEVGRIFRNEGMDPKHNPEFTSIELYQAYTDYLGMMDLVEEMMKTVAMEVCGSLTIPYQGHMIDLSHWERMTMVEAVKKYSGVDFAAIETDEQAIAIAKEKNVALPEQRQPDHPLSGPHAPPEPQGPDDQGGGRQEVFRRGLCRHRDRRAGHRHRQGEERGPAGDPLHGCQPGRVLRGLRGVEPDPAHLLLRLPGGELSPGLAQAQRPRFHRAVRVFHQRHRIRQRLLRAERPQRPISSTPPNSATPSPS